MRASVSPCCCLQERCPVPDEPHISPPQALPRGSSPPTSKSSRGHEELVAAVRGVQKSCPQGRPLGGAGPFLWRGMPQGEGWQRRDRLDMFPRSVNQSWLFCSAFASDQHLPSVYVGGGTCGTAFAMRMVMSQFLSEPAFIGSGEVCRLPACARFLRLWLP